MSTEKRIDGPTPNGGVYMVIAHDVDGQIAIATEYNENDKPIAITTLQLGDDPNDDEYQEEEDEQEL